MADLCTAPIRPKDEPYDDDSIGFEAPIAVIYPSHLVSSPIPHPVSNPIPAENAADQDERTQDDPVMNASTSQANVAEASAVQHDDRGQGKEQLPIAAFENGKTSELVSVQEASSASIDIASSASGEVKLSLMCSPDRPDFRMPSLEAVLKMVEDRCLKSYKILQPDFSLMDVMKEMCQCALELGSESAEDKQESFVKITPALESFKKSVVHDIFGGAPCSSSALPNLMMPEGSGFATMNGIFPNQNLCGESENGKCKKNEGTEVPEASDITCHSLVVVQRPQLALGGKKPIHSILIANNGMAAVKFIRSIRTWAYETFGTEKAILLVAMATPEDLRINAEHIRIADQFVEVPGGTNNNNYANVQLIVEMVEITHVSAVWPGWGHASENPELPDALNAKGIRKVHNDEEVRALFKQVQGEVPGSPIFIMKVASQSRHLEVQLLCDQYRNVAALHSRDCSVQRRHQKIIEEGPITVAPREIVKQLEQAARRLAKCVGYVGAATVEYLYSMESDEFYFLELNPRLQVEHPVTEWIAEINLPAAQVAVGMGIPLWQIPEIRRFYGMNHGGGYDAWRKTSIAATPFDFDKAESVRPKGHCVAVRVTSEDPDDGFKPTSGKVQELSFKSKPNVWAYFSIKSGGGIHEFSDSQFGHVFAFGESRALAIANMVLGLKEIQIRGEIRTNVDYTVDLLHVSEYRDNKIHTGWLDSRIAMRVRAERPPWYLSVVGGALYKASTSSAAIVSDYVGYLGKGQIPPKHISLVNSNVTLNIEGSKYTIEMVRGGPGSYKLRMNESELEVEIHTLRDGGLLMQLDGNSHVIYAEEEAFNSGREEVDLISKDLGHEELTGYSNRRYSSVLKAARDRGKSHISFKGRFYEAQAEEDRSMPGENSSLRSSFSEEGENDEDISSDQSSGQVNRSATVSDGQLLCRIGPKLGWSQGNGLLIQSHYLW